MHVMPVDGRTVYDPLTLRAVPADGLDVPDNDFFWVKAISHGDVAMRGNAAPEAPAHAPHIHDDPTPKQDDAA